MTKQIVHMECFEAELPEEGSVSLQLLIKYAGIITFPIHTTLMFCHSGDFQ